MAEPFENRDRGLIQFRICSLFYGKCEETNDNYDDDYTPNGVEPLSVTGEDQTKQQCLLAMVRFLGGSGVLQFTDSI